MGIYDAVWRSFWVSTLFALIFVGIVQFFPLKVVPWTIVIGGAFSILFGLLIMIMSTGNILLRLVFLFVALGLAGGCIFTLFKE